MKEILKFKSIILFITILFLLFFPIAYYGIMNASIVPTSLLYFSYVILALVLYYLIRHHCYKSIILIYFIYVIIVGLYGNIYSPIDEAAHFDYIVSLNVNHDLPNMFNNGNPDILRSFSNVEIPPTMINHEAVHPPLYYILSSLMSSIFDDYYMKFLMIRFMGMIMIFINLFYVRAALDVIKRYINIRNNDSFLIIVFLIIALSPGYITRLMTVSNEGLAILLCTVVVYNFIKVLFEGCSFKRFVCISILIALAFLTKITTIFLLPVFILEIIYIKKYRWIPLVIFFFCIMIFPWILFNYNTYGSITGTQRHLEIVLPIVNPSNLPIDVISLIPKFFRTFFVAQETNISEITLMLIDAVSLAFSILLLMQILYVIKKSFVIISNKFKFTYEIGEKKEILIYMLSIILVCNFAMLVISTITTRVGVMLGRYMYLSILPIFGLFCLVDVKLHKAVKYICIILISTTLTDTFYSTIQGNQHPIFLYQKQEEKLKLKDSTLDKNDAKVEFVENKMIVFTGEIDPSVSLKLDVIANVTKIKIKYSSNKTENIQIFYNRNDSGFIATDQTLHSLESKGILILENVDSVSQIRIDPPANCLFEIESVEVEGYAKR